MTKFSHPALLRLLLATGGLGLLLAPACIAPSASPPTAASSASALAAAESLRLGSVDFPTSGAAAAQPHFLHGVAALHSFWYEEALEAFARAAQIDPGFAMATWGEGMCYHRSYRPGSDYDAGRRALAKIKDTSRLTVRERGYIGALRTLYGSSGSGDRPGYAAAMEKLYRAYPSDREAAVFYALALLGNRSGGTGSANQEKAGAIAQEVYLQNSNHPGAAHYIIHSHDSPAQASRALTAAQHYSQIAPDAPHALHMPSHIFLQLGMWREAAASNDLGWAASLDYVQRKGLNPTLRDYHNLHWLIYASLQQGRYAKASQLVDDFIRMRGNNDLASYSARYINDALGAFVVETRSWDRADALFTSGATPAAPATQTVPTPLRPLEICGAEPVAATRVSSTPASSDTPAFIRAYAAAARGPAAGPTASQGAKSSFTGIRAAQLRALTHAQAGAFAAAIEAAREAATAEAKIARSSGPPSFKPAHELLGEILLRAGEPTLAIAEFKVALQRHPNRALSLLGRARAEAATGEKTAARATYAKLMEIWEDADGGLPELHEAREFVASVRG